MSFRISTPNDQITKNAVNINSLLYPIRVCLQENSTNIDYNTLKVGVIEIPIGLPALPLPFTQLTITNFPVGKQLIVINSNATNYKFAINGLTPIIIPSSVDMFLIYVGTASITLETLNSAPT